ncbi:hypothetical protein [Streptomyces spinosirectus]
MAPSPDDFRPTPAPAGSPLARDRGLRRNRRLTRWIAVTAVGAAAALGSLYTHLLPGGSASPAPPASPTASSAQSPSASSAAATGDGAGEHGENSQGDDEGEDEGAASAARPAAQPPAQPPAPTRQQPHATTGAS